MTSSERVWARMKATANATARKRKRTILTMPASRLSVLQICRREKAKTPHRDALDLLATSLVRLTLERQYPG
jgi:hypothetical protein